MIHLGTVFSGIGAIEFALKRLGIAYSISFACDNGDRELKILDGEFLQEYTKLTKLRSRKEIDEKGKQRLAELGQLELSKVDEIRNFVYKLPCKKDKIDFVNNLYKNTRQENFVEKTYKANYNITDTDFYQDIRFMDGREYEGTIDLLVGGSPCQSFSSVGAKGGLDDTRGTLFYDYARIIREIQPKAFIYENVRGLLTHDNGKTWKIIKRVFEEDLNYNIQYSVLNAADYGIPQNRRRLFVIGIRDDIKCEPFEMPTPISLKYTMQNFLEDSCSDGHFNYDRRSGELVIEAIPGKADDKFILTPAVQRYVLAEGTANYKTSTKTDLPVARTLMKMMTQHHRAGVDNYITVQNNPLVLRQLSDREALRLMGFTDDFKIVVSSMQMLRQAGNSIVVDTLMRILHQLLKTGIYKSINYDNRI